MVHGARDRCKRYTENRHAKLKTKHPIVSVQIQLKMCACVVVLLAKCKVLHSFFFGYEIIHSDFINWLTTFSVLCVLRKYRFRGEFQRMIYLISSISLQFMVCVCSRTALTCSIFNNWFSIFVQVQTIFAISRKKSENLFMTSCTRMQTEMTKMDS